MTGMTFGSDCIVNGVPVKAGTVIKFASPSEASGMPVTDANVYHDAMRQPRLAVRYVDGTEEDRPATPLERALYARSESAATIAPPTKDEIDAYRNLFRTELDKNMNNSSGSPSTDAHTVALHAFVAARNAKARRFAAPDLSAPENVMRGRD
jgi:hypothetical protein